MQDMRQYMRQRRAKNQAYARKLLGSRCSICGSTKNLEFDHKDRATKVIGIADMLSHSLDKLTEELRKCQLLCHDCHNSKTIKDMGWRDSRREHGTPRSILHCKCLVCRAAHNQRMREYRKSKKK